MPAKAAHFYSFDGIKPVIDSSAFVHPTAVVIGDVIVGPDCYVGPNSVLRGDFGRIRLGRAANFQETCVAHSFPGEDVTVEDYGHIGHGAVLHGCTVGENAMIGMNAVIMDRAHIGANCIVGALSMVKANWTVPEGQLVVGNPARIERALEPDEIEWKRQGTDVYRQLALDAPERLALCDPLDHVEPNRRKISRYRVGLKQDST
ncbi:MAG: transferase hexapeptide repeat family protein [Pseudomonadota bacterium]